MSTRFDLLKKYVPGASQLTRPKVLIAAVNYIAILKQTIQRMTENSTVHSPMDCTWPFSTVDLTVDSSDSLSPVHEDSFTQECTVPLTSSPEPMEDSVLSGPALSDFLDPTLENLVPGHLRRRRVTRTEFFEGFNRMAKHRLPLSLMWDFTFFNTSRKSCRM
jgi:hypothetical protein